MNDVTLAGLGSLSEIIDNIDNYPIEVKAVVLDVLRDMNSQIYEKKRFVESKIIQDMQADNATKELFVGSDGIKKIMTLKSGSMKAEMKSDEVVNLWVKSGFNINELGNFEFKPSWSKAREQRKFGGEKQNLIDKIFKSGISSIEIKELK